MSENLTSPDSIASSSSSLPQGSATPSAPVQPQESKRGPSKYEVITHDHISSEWTTPIKHSQIPETLFKTRLRAEPVDALETTGFSRSSPSTQNAPRIANDFLQSLIDRRPKDARFNVPFIKMLSPMVRYSKLPFRLLCRRYGADLAFTPMLIANDMIGVRGGTPVSLDEFSTCPEDRPLIAQLASNDPTIAQQAALAVMPYVDGVDLNCGCPQPWVVKDGIGAALSQRPQLVSDLVQSIRRVVPSEFPVSIKIRLRPDMRDTIELARRAEKMGVSWITVHGRTKEERTSVPVRLPAIRLVRENLGIPIIANGDMTTPKGMVQTIDETGAAGVLIARGALANPCMFAGLNDIRNVSYYTNAIDWPYHSSLISSHHDTRTTNHPSSTSSIVPETKSIPSEDIVTKIRIDPRQSASLCLSDYLSFALSYGGTFAMHQHHILYMTYALTNKADKSALTKLKSLPSIIEFCRVRGWIDECSALAAGLTSYQTHQSKDSVRGGDGNSEGNNDSKADNNDCADGNIIHEYAPIYSASRGHLASSSRYPITSNSTGGKETQPTSQSWLPSFTRVPRVNTPDESGSSQKDTPSTSPTETGNKASGENGWMDYGINDFAMDEYDYW